MRRGMLIFSVVLLILAVLAMVAWVGAGDSFKAAVGSPQTGLPVEQRSTSILVEVFKPAIDWYNAALMTVKSLFGFDARN